MLKLLLTCEHGGNQVPAGYSSLFQGHQHQLATHRGYDIGALELFRALEPLADISFYSETTRLLVELNRSLHHNNLFSDITRALPDDEKVKVLREYYYPYRDKVEQLVDDFARAGRKVLHIAVHTFTPNLDGEERQADIGLLYDPKRREEQAICKTWKIKLQEQDEHLMVRFNYPYLGIADGFPTYLRRKFSENEYLGIELEVNQKLVLADKQTWNRVQQQLTSALHQLLEPYRREQSDLADLE